MSTGVFELFSVLILICLVTVGVIDFLIIPCRYILLLLIP